VRLHELRSPEGARTKPRRIGRGTGSGRGKTSGRGQKGQLARSEGFRLGFEGGQMPLAQRLPKLGGFKNPFKKVYAVVNLTKLNRFKDGAEVDLHGFYEAGLAKPGEDVKLLGTGKLRRKLTLEVHAASESARAAIEARGGKLTLIERAARAPQTKRGKAAPAEAAPKAAKAEAPAKHRPEPEPEAQAGETATEPAAHEEEASAGEE
jgi:large subunit ribosomal protein L15